MSGGEANNPPVLDDSTNYEAWKKDLEVWKLFTSTSDNKKGPRLYLSLKGKAREIVRDMDLNIIGAEDGLDQLVAKLDEHFQKNKVQRSYIELEQFEKFKRESDMPINEYITQFEHLNTKIKEHQMTLPDGVLAYKLLHQANLSDSEVNLIKATMKKLSYKEIKEKMLTIFQDITSKVNIKSEPSIKVEGIYYNSEMEGTRYWNRGKQRGRGNRGWGYNRGAYDVGGKYSQRSLFDHQGQTNSYMEGATSQNQTRKLNPPDETGKPSRCAICESIYHWARKCPHSYENMNLADNGTQYDEELQYSEEQDESTRIPLFIKYNNDISEVGVDIDGQGLVVAVIDSGAPDTVSGKAWIEKFVQNLSDEERKLVIRKPGYKKYKFGNGKPVIAKETLSLPVTIADREVLLTTDVDIPLLIGKSALKKADAVINFKDDTIELFGEKERLLVNSSGHYMIPVQSNVESKTSNLSNYNDGDIEYQHAKQLAHEKVAVFKGEEIKCQNVKNQKAEKVYTRARVEKEEIDSTKQIKWNLKRKGVNLKPPAEENSYKSRRLLKVPKVTVSEVNAWFSSLSDKEQEHSVISEKNHTEDI